ncbi:MAG: hypothetical protein HY026_04245 [Deltaproteobacteria bacterium]|nr:hypothetical protein [Deltaproteobacteria bacterium]
MEIKMKGLKKFPVIFEFDKKYGFGSGASRLVSENMGPHKELEQRLAR